MYQLTTNDATAAFSTAVKDTGLVLLKMIHCIHRNVVIGVCKYTVYAVAPLNIINSAQVLINSTGELFCIFSFADTITAYRHTCCLLEWVTRLDLLVLQIHTQ